MDALLTTLMALTLTDLLKLGGIVAVLGIWPTLKVAINKRVQKWGDRERLYTDEDEDIDRVTRQIQEASPFASLMPSFVVRRAVRKHRSSNPPPSA